jgi:hypothetical protein
MLSRYAITANVSENVSELQASMPYVITTTTLMQQQQQQQQQSNSAPQHLPLPNSQQEQLSTQQQLVQQR